MERDVVRTVFKLGDRIHRLRNIGKLEEAAVANLKHLGELKRPYLTRSGREAAGDFGTGIWDGWQLAEMKLFSRTYLTDVEFRLLQWLSEYYGVGEER